MPEATQNVISMTNFAWLVLRSGVVKCDDGDKVAQVNVTPSWREFNRYITKEDIPQKVVAFLPVIPQPVTQYNTVYTALRNFQGIRRQLLQTALAVACDEGVYHIAREVILIVPDEFNDIVLTLGSFHMTKVFLSCIEKYLCGSGAEEIWIENSILKSV